MVFNYIDNGHGFTSKACQPEKKRGNNMEYRIINGHLMNSNSLDSLQPINAREDFKQLSSKGGQASGKSRRLKKLWISARRWNYHDNQLKSYESFLLDKYHTDLETLYQDEFKITIKECNHLRALNNRENKYYLLFDEIATTCEEAYGIDINEFISQKVEEDNQLYLYMVQYMKKHHIRI